MGDDNKSSNDNKTSDNISIGVSKPEQKKVGVSLAEGKPSSPNDKKGIAIIEGEKKKQGGGLEDK